MHTLEVAALLSNTKAISPFITQAIGIDLSAKMISAYNTLSQENLLSEKMSATQGDLLSPSSSTTDLFQDSRFFNFDIIIMSMALHHVSDTQLMIEKLHERLSEGGVLVIVDWLTMGLGGTRDRHGHQGGHGQEKKLPGSHTVAHFGFSMDEMKKLYEKAGMVDIGFMDGIEKSKVPAEMGGEQQVFIAKARKAVRN